MTLLPGGDEQRGDGGGGGAVGALRCSKTAAVMSHSATVPSVSEPLSRVFHLVLRLEDVERGLLEAAAEQHRVCEQIDSDARLAADLEDEVTPGELRLCAEADRCAREEAEVKEMEEALRLVHEMKRADHRAEAKRRAREAGGVQHEPHQDHTTTSSASAAGAGDFEVRGGPHPHAHDIVHMHVRRLHTHAHIHVHTHTHALTILSSIIYVARSHRHSPPPRRPHALPPAALPR